MRRDGPAGGLAGTRLGWGEGKPDFGNELPEPRVVTVGQKESAVVIDPVEYPRPTHNGKSGLTALSCARTIRLRCLVRQYECWTLGKAPDSLAAMLGEPENQSSLTRAALSTRGAQKAIS